MSSPINYAWSRAAHGFVSDAEVDAFFRQEHLPDFRTFDPGFSPIRYVVRHGDVGTAGVHPTFHYLAHGHEEGREVAPTTSLAPYPAVAAATRDLPRGDARIAIVLHIYYADFVEYFLKRLGGLDFPNWDVFVSASAEVAAEHGDTLREALGDRLRAVQVVPNRGRNFVGLFTDFAAMLAGYDAICHCHSKQSRYTGRRQTLWADYLVAALIGAPDTVRRHVNLLLSGQCDVVAPAPFIGMPPWASHTLSNEPHFSALCRRLGLDPTGGFLAYPVGGMLWMTGAVHQAIAGLALAHDDYPEEPSRPDGELHHALERVIGRLAGSKLAFFDQVTGQYWAAHAVLRAEMRRFPPLSDLCEAIKDKDLVSFDFFDTLATRATGDEEWAKRRVEYVLGQDYHARRNEAEAVLRGRLGPGEDVPLSLIAAELAGQGFSDAPRAIALERAFDLATLAPRAEVVHAYERAIEDEKHVMIVSDSYYDQGLIRSFLEREGISLPTQILTSADIGLRKDRGDLWRHMRAVKGRADALHVGDNVHSDIQKASESGFHTFYVPHWRSELLPFAGLSPALVQRNLTNPGFARSIDRAAPEQIEDELSKPAMDGHARRVRDPRRPRKDKAA